MNSQVNTQQVYIIEDDTLLSGMIARMLQEDHFAVRSAETGEIGLDDIKKEPPDVILLDLALPGMNGFSVLERLKRDATLKHLPVIVFTNFGDHSDIERATELGAHSYIIKANVSPRDIVENIHAIFAQ